MPPGDNARLIDELTRSFTTQVGLYDKLKTVVQKTLGQITRSRGDLSSVKSLFEAKRNCLAAISLERERVRESTAAWIAIKATAPRTAAVLTLEKVLGAVEHAIGEFLESEAQLQKYLEHLMKKSPAS
jgi:flagellar biosynthesis/type III secretory pathway chaperone